MATLPSAIPLPPTSCVLHRDGTRTPWHHRPWQRNRPISSQCRVTCSSASTRSLKGPAPPGNCKLCVWSAGSCEWFDMSFLRDYIAGHVTVCLISRNKQRGGEALHCSRHAETLSFFLFRRHQRSNELRDLALLGYFSQLQSAEPGPICPLHCFTPYQVNTKELSQPVFYILIQMQTKSSLTCLKCGSSEDDLNP